MTALASISSTPDLPLHPVAELFPAMDAESYRSLVDDIAKHGLLQPVWTFEGQIIDGRHRQNACRELGLPLLTREWSGDGSLADFVLSLNLQRRHLTTSQRSIIALHAMPHYKAEAKARQTAAGSQNLPGASHAISGITRTPARQGPAREAAARAVGVSASNVGYAMQIEREAPELIDEIREGKMTIGAAQRTIRERRDSVKPSGAPLPRVAQEFDRAVRSMVVEATLMRERAEALVGDGHRDQWVTDMRGIRTALTQIINLMGRE
jgi:hypothetical protein